MRLTLGEQTYDVTTRPLVIGTIPALATEKVATARRFVQEGAAAIEVTDPAAVDAVRAAVDIPVGIATDRFDAVWVAYQAGAVFGTCPDPAFLVLSAESGAAVVVRDVGPAKAAHIPADRIAVEMPAGHRLASRRSSSPMLVTTNVVAVAALAVTDGARVVRTTEVKAMRRVCDVLAAIIEARP
jgi:hypothetical protein